MYLIELNDTDIYNIASESEYFTATEDEYFSADEYFSSGSHSAMSRSTGSILSMSSKSKTALTNNKRRKTDREYKTKWTFDETEPRSKYKSRKHIPVDAAAMRNYYLWRRTVIAGHHPRDAAHMIGSQFCFKQVRQKRAVQLFSIRLNVEHRVFFTINEKECIVKVLNIGGHSFK